MYWGKYMGRNTMLRAVLAAAIAFGAVLANAVTPAMATTVVSTANQVDMATVLLDRVRKMALSDSLAEVRADAWQAVFRHNDGDANAIRDFVVSGYGKAKTRAQQRIERNLRYVQDVNRYSIPGSAVRVTSTYALAGTASAQDEYVRNGHARAQELDRANNHKYEERLARLAQEDRDYVAQLAADDPGVQVKAAAQRALAGDDTTIGLFFKHYWGIGADLDNEGFRRRTIEQNEVWHQKIESLRQAALAAEAAERESSGELARKARLDAIAKWDEADRESARSSVDWSAEKSRADAQAAAWARIAEHARTAQSEQDWAEVLRRAGESGGSWADEAEWARQQATTWQAMAAEMRKNADAARDRDQGDQ